MTACAAFSDWITGTGTEIGSVISTRDDTHDAELILTNSAHIILTDPSTQDDIGDPDMGQIVNGGASTNVGDTICEGGAQTGEVCGFVVTAVHQAFTIDGFGHVDSMVQVEAPNHVAGIGNGDSGGPVYVYGTTRGVTARGTISSFSSDPAEEVDCKGVPTSSVRHCSWKWWYPDVTVQFANLGVHF